MRLIETCCAAALMALLLATPADAQTSPPQAPNPERARTLTRFSAATEVQLRDVAAIVRVIPENRTDVAIGYVNTGATPAPEYRVSRHRLIVDGKLRRQIRSCRVVGADGFEVQATGQERLEADLSASVASSADGSLDAAVRKC